MSAIIFFVDIQFPLGIAGGVPYALIVLSTYWIKKRRYTILAGILSTLLAVTALLYSDSLGPPMMAISNRLVAIFVIWGTVWFVINYKNSLAEIKRNEKWISALFEAATVGMLISDMDGRIVFLNEKIEKMFGYSREELIGKKIEILVPDRIRSIHHHHRQSYYDNPEPRPMGKGRDLYGLKKNGEEFPLEVNLNYFETEEGKFVTSFVVDITERKTAEKHLQQAQELAHIGSYEMDLETGEVIWSDETFRIFEMSPKGKAPDYEELKTMLHPAYVDNIETAIEKVQKEGKREFLELGITTKKGNTRYIYSIVDPVKNKKGEVVRIFGTTQDITHRKKAEEQRIENVRRYRMLFKAATDEIMVFQLDDDMEPLPFMEVNDIACDILGYTREELLEKKVYDIISADKEEIKKRIREALREKERVYETQHISKDGTVIPLEISVRAFTYNGRPTIISVGRDVRERRKLEQEILNISERERQRIGRDMHDDLGQMLTGIGLIAQTLSNDLESKGLQAAEKVQEIADLVKEADEHSRALSRGLVPVNIDSNGLDYALRELTRKSSKMYDIDINYFNGQENIIDNNSSAIHLYRIAQEAINNAVKNGNATVIDVKLTSNDDHMTLCIDDNGSGFPEPEERGDGMGVRIMNFRAQMIGGNLEINSEKGKGAEIICQIPISNL
jgi:two-component system CheB/CheR fusion protein